MTGEADTAPQLRALLDPWAAVENKGVIFDFNGTLSDDEPVLLQIFMELFHEHLRWTLTEDYYYAHLAGLSDREIIAVTLERDGRGNRDEFTTAMLAQRRQRYHELVAARSTISAATAGLVHRIAGAGVPIGIVTGAQRADVDAVLAHSSVAAAISATVTEENVTHGKPDPEGFLAAAAALGLAPADILVFEDSLPGLAAARAAVMRSIAVAGTRSRAELAGAADAVVGSLDAGVLDGAFAG